MLFLTNFLLCPVCFGGKIGFNSVQDTFQFCHMWMTFKNKAMNYWGSKCISLHFLTWETWKYIQLLPQFHVKYFWFFSYLKENWEIAEGIDISLFSCEKVNVRATKFRADLLWNIGTFFIKKPFNFIPRPKALIKSFILWCFWIKYEFYSFKF